MFILFSALRRAICCASVPFVADALISGSEINQDQPPKASATTILHDFIVNPITRKALMKTIKLTQGQVALVDDWRYEELNRWKWHAYWDERTQSFYAC